jgi:hypothetical protein
MGCALLDPAGPRGHLLERLTELASSAVSELRRTGQASVKRTQSTQVIEVMIRQLGHLFLQPMLDAMWRQLADPDAPCATNRSSRCACGHRDRNPVTSNYLSPAAGSWVGCGQPVSARLQRGFSAVPNCGHRDGGRPEPEMARFYGRSRRFTGVAALRQVLGPGDAGLV